jgi:hypothetical protein
MLEKVALLFGNPVKQLKKVSLPPQPTQETETNEMILESTEGN